MNQNYSPNLFLFQNYIEEVIKEGKKHIKTAPFDNVPQPIFNNQKSQYIDLYHTYFLAAMSHLKTRQLACLNYQKLLRQALVDKQRLPASMISSVLTACSNIGGSTSGSSSLGSASLNNNPQNQNLYIGNLIKSILLYTYQPTSQITVGLNYLLEGTRKKYSYLYIAMLEEVYNDFLIRFRQSAINRFVSSHLNGILDQIQAHFNDQAYVFASRKTDIETGKVDIPTYAESNKLGKFGKCFICQKPANHYMKDQFIPICSIICKERVKELLEGCKTADEFTVLGWIIDNLNGGDQIVYTFLRRELEATITSHLLSYTDLLQILRAISHLIENPQIIKYLLPSLSLIITKWQLMIPSHEVTSQAAEQLQLIFKTFYHEIIVAAEELPIAKQQLQFISFFHQILKSQNTLIYIFNNYDCQFFQPNILGRMLNLLSQYARKYDNAVDALHSIVKTLMNRYITKNKRSQDWPFFQEYSKKRQLKKAITLFNKKPLHGIKYFKKIFEVNSLNVPSKQQVNQSAESPIKSFNNSSLENVEEAQKQLQKNEKNELERQKVEEQATIVKEEQENIEKQINQNNEFENVEPVLQQAPLSLNKISIAEEQQKERVRVSHLHIALFIRQFSQAKSFYQPDSRRPIPLPLLSQAKVGEYFGLDNPEVRQVCQAYLQTFFFQDYEIDDMMRIILNSFSLPKQTQMVDRIIGDIAKRLVGFYQLQNDTQSYQYFYLLLMVQTTNHNPNVRDSQRLKLDSFLKMCFSMIGRIPQKAEADYNRILQHSINLKMKYPQNDFFTKKYLGKLREQTSQLFREDAKGSQAKNILTYIWEYLVIGLVWPGNSKGLLESVILLGKEGLGAQQRTFFEALKKEGPLEQSRDAILKIGIQHGNQLHGDLWSTIISLIYKLQNENQFSSAVLDKLFTNSGKLNPERLRDFLRALLQFSKSEIKHDSMYNRELFVLRHINSLLQYNIPRFLQLAPYIWTLLQGYFKDICLHPRKEVSMGAIDSFKQMTLKLLKLPDQAVPHDALMQTFLYIFERSCLQMKDLIANVLLNLITVDLRSGWESIYQILDILDTKDKQLVIRILDRLIGQIGLARLTNLSRLHSICIKQLRICNQPSIVQQQLTKLWQLSLYINDAAIWLQSIRSIKDIFKISLNNDLLEVFIRMCNRCIAQQPKAIADKDIFNQLVDLLMFLIDLKGSSPKVNSILLNSLQCFKETNPNFIVKFLGGTFGFLSIFQLYLSSDLKIPFSIFIKTYFIANLLPVLRQPSNILQFQQFGQWCINQFYDHLPLELINLKQKDKDFQKTLSNLIQNDQLPDKDTQTQLIQFHLSYKEYKQKSIIHLVLLDITQEIYKQSENIPKLRQKIQQSVLDSHDCAFKINRYILLRNFLWKNGFLNAKHLPGLHRQQHRTLIFAIKEFPFSKIYFILKKFIMHYLITNSLISSLKKVQKDINKSQKKKGGSKQAEEKESRSFQTYLTDAQLWLNQAHRGVCMGWSQIRWQLNTEGKQGFAKGELEQLIELGLKFLSLRTIPSSVCNQTSDALKSIYQLIL